MKRSSCFSWKFEELGRGWWRNGKEMWPLAIDIICAWRNRPATQMLLLSSVLFVPSPGAAVNSSAAAVCRSWPWHLSSLTRCSYNLLYPKDKSSCHPVFSLIYTGLLDFFFDNAESLLLNIIRNHKSTTAELLSRRSQHQQPSSAAVTIYKKLGLFGSNCYCSRSYVCACAQCFLIKKNSKCKENFEKLLVLKSSTAM